MRIGLNGSSLLMRPDLGTITTDIVTAEAEGFDSYWLAQTSLVDAVTMLGLAGQSTRRIQLGTAVVPTWTQHPVSLAATAMTAQAATGGRITLGIGLAHKPTVEDRLHMKWEKPVRHMREYVEILNGLFQDGKASHRGEVWSFEGEMATPTTEPPRLMLAALGDQMLRLAGRHADGTILWCVGPKTIAEHIAPVINTAAGEAGRPAPSIVCSIPCWVTDDEPKARAFIAAVLAGYAELPSYRAMLDIEGIHGLEDLSFVGTADQVRDGIEAVRASGATDFTPVIMGGNPDEQAATRAVLAEAASA